jgi:hypothetical protein
MNALGTSVGWANAPVATLEFCTASRAFAHASIFRHVAIWVLRVGKIARAPRTVSPIRQAILPTLRITDEVIE